MGITRKPSKPDVAALIERGGSPPRAPGMKIGKMNVQLRLARGLVARIDAAIGERLVPIPRHTWILEAIAEKLDRHDC